MGTVFGLSFVRSSALCVACISQSMTFINESDSASAEQQRSIKSEIWASPVNTCDTVSGNGDEQPASRSYVEHSRNSTPSGFELGTPMASARSNGDEDLIALNISRTEPFVEVVANAKQCGSSAVSKHGRKLSTAFCEYGKQKSKMQAVRRLGHLRARED